MTDRATKQFLRWRDRGDPRALADLFDRTAPELLRVGLHLCGNVADAEDLLQATFVAAIESAERFDAGRRVVPWLVAILTHRAQAERRRQRRAPADGVDGDAVAGNGAEPAAAAAARELAGISLTALDELPEPYRQPTMLRVAQGMEPAAIALLLGRSPATVRSQIHRGLAQVRGRLPAGAGAVVTFGGERGLAAVKGAVLEHARATFAHGVGASAAVAGGVIMTAKTLTILVLLGGIAVAIGYSATSSDSLVPASQTAVASQRGDPAPLDARDSRPTERALLTAPAAMPSQAATSDAPYPILRLATAEEVAWGLQQCESFQASLLRTIAHRSGSANIDDRFQLARMQYHMAEYAALMSQLKLGKAYARTDGIYTNPDKLSLPELDGTQFRPVGTQYRDGWRVVYVPIRWSERPDVVALHEEAERIRDFSQEQSAYRWNQLPYEQRRQIVEAGRAADARLQAGSQQMEELRRQGESEDGPAMRALSGPRMGLQQTWMAMPQGLDANLLATPGRTSFNKTY